ncbi:putative glycoside hydrolase [Arthrobacter sp. ov118]|uniref:putative glycoside hydrolase n=1 Tax=Arthrobacter sp. ov118 TaxID=1761747 RepID=UPI0035291F87
MTAEQIDFAAEHYRAAILQPWELDAARELKSRRPDMTLLCYKCLSSTRDYEPGPIYSSGVSFAEAEREGAGWFAQRLDGRRVEWDRYPGHWQMKVWDPEYLSRWVANVIAELEDSPFDGVMADNDVFDDYYGLNLPLRGAESLSAIRAGLNSLIHDAGPRLNRVGKVLVPNIAESRREPGRWASHASYGGGFEEVWLGYSATNLFDPATVEAQLPQAEGPGLTILRVPTDGNDRHPNFSYGLAAFWVFNGGTGAYSATAHDDYSRTQYSPELDWDLGQPLGAAKGNGHAWLREFTGGWAAVNFNQDGRRRRRLKVPPGMVDANGAPAPHQLVLGPHRGVLYRRA